MTLLDSLSTRTDLKESASQLAALIEERTQYLVSLERKAIARKYEPIQLFIGALVGLPLGYAAYALWTNTDHWRVHVLAVFIGLAAVIFVAVAISNFFRPPSKKTPTTE